jgi:hypothetical protein
MQCLYLFFGEGAFMENKESGAVMVEAVIYFPIVIMIVALIICISMAKLEESILYYETEKVAHEAVSASRYVGYENLLDMDEVNLKAGLSSYPTADQVKAYYKAQIQTVYNFKITYSGEESEFENRLSQMISNFYFLGSGIADPQCDVAIKGGLAPRAEVSVLYSLHLPKMLNYLTAGTSNEGIFDNVKIATHTRSVAINPTEYVRNIDIAYDLVKYLADKLGISDDIQGMMDKLKTMKEKII